MAKANTEAAHVMVLPRAAKARRTSAQAWIERTNPLTRLSLRAAQSIYDTARGGGYARLQYIYAEIEKTDPTLFICVDRRLSALSALGWRVVANVEGAAAEAQKKRLEDMLSGAAGLGAAIEHMGLAFFRGFSFCEPYMRSGRLAFNCPPSWEFNRSPDGTWWHNPLVIEGDAGGAGQTAFDPEAVIHIERVRAVDYPALALYLRHEVAEDQWGRFLERYGIPPVLLEMPPLSQPGDADRFAQAAQQVYEALCGAVPNGTKVNTLAEARGADPFSGFIEHQEKTMVRLCTGGTLGSIAEATGIGSGASAAQGDVWREIVARDAVLIGEEFTRWFARHVFPEGMLVRFELGTEKRATPDEVFETAAKARQAGYRFTKEYLETETGAELENDAATLLPGPFGGIAANKPGATLLQNAENRLQNAPRVLDGQREGRERETRLRPFLDALRNDVKPIAELVDGFMANPTPGRAKLFLEKLPECVPEDPALASAIAEEMAKAYGAAWEESRAEARRGGEAEAAANKTDANGMEHDAATGQFTEKDGGASAEAASSHSPQDGITQETAEKLYKGDNGRMKKCPQDGGFIGECGCTHPNHRHSEPVERLLAENKPGKIQPAVARAALSEGFYVDGPDGRVGFGKRLLAHIEEHGRADADGRLARLAFAIDTVRSPDRIEKAHHAIAGRTAYFKEFKDFGMVAISGEDGKGLEYVFTIVPKRGKK